MSDEQTIYISPEDDLTNVRERLESLPTRRVTLVIPAQTQLRSHVAWKLLHARARELGKEVIIVSSDPQIRSVAQAVKFKVAHSLEASPVGRSRPMSRPGRTSAGGRSRSTGSSHSRTQFSRENVEPRGSGSAGGTGGAGGVRSRLHEDLPTQWYSTSPERTSPPQEPQSKKSRADETITGGLDASSTFDIPDERYGQPYDFQIDTAPSIPPIRPLSPEQLEEEPDLLLEDFNQAQDIRQAARKGSSGGIPNSTLPPLSPTTPAEAAPSERQRQTYRDRITHLSNADDDPFAYMEDSQPPPRAEQLGSVSLDDYDTDEHMIQDIPATPIREVESEIEYQRDQGDFDIYGDSSPAIQAWSEPAPEPDTTQAMSGPRVYGRGSRPGNTGQMPPRQDFESEDALPPIDERPTQVTPQVPPTPPAPVPTARASSRGLTSANRPLQLPTTTRNRPALSRPVPRQTRSRTTASRARSSTGVRKPARSDRRGYTLGLIVAALILLIGCLAYFVPAATVTITLPSRDYSTPVKLTAAPPGQQKAGPATVPAVTLTKNFSKSGTGQATGSTKIGTATATGSVTFTNNTSAPVHIPTGTVIATAGSNSVQFATTADVIVPVQGSAVGNTIQDPIQAQAPGDSGNVPAGSITVIPNDSLNAIARVNNVTASSLNLQVTNTSATTGGGAGNATTITAKDLDNAKNTLQSQLQGDINAWLQKQVSSNDVSGKPVIDAALVNPLPVGQVASSGTFPAKLNATVTVLVVRSAALQTAAESQLNAALKKDKTYTGFTIVADAAHPIVIHRDQMKVSGDAHTLTLSFPATGKAIPDISREKTQVQTLIVGKSIKDARAILSSQPGVQSVAITVSPSFISWVPFWTGHIDVRFVPGTAPPSAPTTPKK
jgi:hypothetical protein